MLSPSVIIVHLANRMMGSCLLVCLLECLVCLNVCTADQNYFSYTQSYLFDLSILSLCPFVCVCV